MLDPVVCGVKRLHTSVPIVGTRRPCRDAGVGAIVLGLAMLERAKRASHIDPPASSHAIMRRACPYRGENPGPGKDAYGELDPWPGIREQPRPISVIRSPYILRRSCTQTDTMVPTFLRALHRNKKAPTEGPSICCRTCPFAALEFWLRFAGRANHRSTLVQNGKNSLLTKSKSGAVRLPGSSLR